MVIISEVGSIAGAVEVVSIVVSNSMVIVPIVMSKVFDIIVVVDIVSIVVSKVFIAIVCSIVDGSTVVPRVCITSVADGTTQNQFLIF